MTSSNRAVSPPHRKRGPDERNNVVVFFTDQQRWDTMGLHGNPLGLTPNLDRMARQGTFFCQAFTCQPLCGPARSSLQTGLYATQTACFKNDIPLPTHLENLGSRFKRAGYSTGYIGKWHLAGLEEPVPAANRIGYDYWLGANNLESVSEPYNMVLFDNQDKPVKLPGYRVDAMTDAAIRFIDDQQDQPFFLTVSYLEPHDQDRNKGFIAPDGYRERYTGRWTPSDLEALTGYAHKDLAGYWGMAKKLDEAYGRILDALKSLDLADSTVVLFTSDHGCHFGTRNEENKRSPHDSSIRIPMVAHGPGFQAGGWRDELVSLVDVAPTLLDAAGIAVPEGMAGRSFLPVLRGGDQSWPDDVFVQVSESVVGRAVRTRRWKYAVEALGKDGKVHPDAVRYEEKHLYDLELDPYELRNLVGQESHRPVADRMKERLIRRMLEAGEAEPVIDDAPPVESGDRYVTVEEINR